MGWFSNVFSHNPFSNKGLFGSIYTRMDDFGKNVVYQTGRLIGQGESTEVGQIKKAQQEAADAASVKAAALAQEQAGMQGQADQLLRLRMRKGFLSTILSGGAAGSALSDMTAARKALLGQ